MNTNLHHKRLGFFRKKTLVLTALTLLLLTCTTHAGANAKRNGQDQTVNGFVEGNGAPQPGYTVSLYVSYVGGQKKGQMLGSDMTDAEGKFSISYRLPTQSSKGVRPILFVLAEDGPVMLSTVIGTDSYIHNPHVVNELTTVATGTAFAQFVEGRQIRGNTYGMLNAAKMVENMADPKTGNASAVLTTSPNGGLTRTYRTFNSLANVVANCVAEASNCFSLFTATSPAGEPPVTTVLQAIANMTKFPSHNLDTLFDLSLNTIAYTPALGPLEKPTSWLLFIKFTGGTYSFQDENNLMNGPGNIAIDERGFAWINDNYVPQREEVVACAGLRLMKFYPWGETFPGSPYFGGGLSGAGFGITLDPRGKVWVGNFGFEAPVCADPSMTPPDPQNKIPATHNSLSVFNPDGSPQSSADGITNGNMWWPQATVSDKKGDIWVANCGNDTVTRIPNGKEKRAMNFALPGAGSSTAPLVKPFGLAIDPKGRAWVTGNESEKVYRIWSNGTVETLDSGGLLTKPMGISGDSQGNMWVSNSDAVKVPCVDPYDPTEGGNPSIVFYPANGIGPQQFKGGGLSIPWGNAVDGNDTLWVFNFGHTPIELNLIPVPEWPETGLSHFCGTGKCPAGKKLGDNISPDITGYRSDALERVTGGNIDPSGNIWLMNNWKKDAPVVYDTNPGGNSFVIVPGAAAPVKTPLIGPPQSFNKNRQ